jgi:hypothetical protein
VAPSNPAKDNARSRSPLLSLRCLARRSMGLLSVCVLLPPPDPPQNAQNYPAHPAVCRRSRSAHWARSYSWTTPGRVAINHGACVVGLRRNRPRHHLQLRRHLAAGALRDHRQRPGQPHNPVSAPAACPRVLSGKCILDPLRATPPPRSNVVLQAQAVHRRSFVARGTAPCAHALRINMTVRGTTGHGWLSPILSASSATPPRTRRR